MGLFVSFSVQAAYVKFIVNTAFNTPDQAQIFLTGNFNQCHWKANCIELNKVSDHQYSKTLEINESFEYKVTRGDWWNEAADQNGIPHKNHKVHISFDPLNPFQSKLQVVDIKNWKDLGPLKVTGNMEVITKVYSPQLLNFRSIHVRLPDSYYDKGNQHHYPVIYMHDGQNCFNPKTSTFGTDWSVDEVLSKMVKEGKVRDAIVVGVFHQNRHLEYNDDSQGQLYGQFLVETVKPLIDQKYRTLKEKEDTFLMGSSYGSAISMSLAWRYPHVFSRAAGLAFNASFFNDMIFRLSSDLPHTTAKIYVDHGDLGGEAKFKKHGQRFIQHLKSIGFDMNQIEYLQFPFTAHTEADWARRVHKPLEFLLK